VGWQLLDQDMWMMRLSITLKALDDLLLLLAAQSFRVAPEE
jgi:hypothetical protein